MGSRHPYRPSVPGHRTRTPSGSCRRARYPQGRGTWPGGPSPPNRATLWNIRPRPLQSAPPRPMGGKGRVGAVAPTLPARLRAGSTLNEAKDIDEDGGA